MFLNCCSDLIYFDKKILVSFISRKKKRRRKKKIDILGIR